MWEVLAAVAVLVAAFLKGALGFGFPMLATPILVLFIDVKIAVAALVVPNLVMDTIQLSRRGGAAKTVRRFATLLVGGGVGTVVGTRLLVFMPPRVAAGLLGGLLLLFVALNATRFAPRVPAHWEPWLSPPVGFFAGVVGGVTNVPGTAIVLYFYALGMEKYDFVRSAAFTFIVYKAVQAGSLVAYGLLSWRLLPLSLGLTALGLGAFAVGLRVQDRLDQRAFNRAILVFLAALGLWLAVRAVG